MCGNASVRHTVVLHKIIALLYVSAFGPSFPFMGPLLDFNFVFHVHQKVNFCKDF